MIKRTILFALVILLTPTLIIAQDTTHTSSLPHDLGYKKFQLSFFPCLSTSGTDASKYAFKYSFNIISGYNGALENGYEFGGVFNINRYYSDGFQLAGVGNYTQGPSSGVMMAGAVNIAGETMTGIQMSGAINYSRLQMEGIQMAGALNLSGRAEGMQLAGGANISLGRMEGFMVGGGLNLATSSAEGFMVAGGANIAVDQMEGFLVAGGLNYARQLNGFVVAPLNISGSMSGFQAGVVNVTGKAEGLQLGVLNYANEMEGAPIGFLSIVKNGRYNLDVWASDGGFVNAGIKLGTQDIYNQLSMGYNPTLDRDTWQVGWSIGSFRPKKHVDLYSDFSVFSIYTDSWKEETNLLFKYRFMLGKELTKGVSIYGGPTLNALFADEPYAKNYT
jgi:hypothetical protein